jgi:hypothetical protein
VAESAVNLATNAGATFTIPEGWSPCASGSLTELAPPEEDLRIVIVEVGQAADARRAVAAA